MKPNNYLGEINVTKPVQPLPRVQRKAPELQRYRWYFISFFDKYAYPCRLVDIIEGPGLIKRIVAVEIPCKPESPKGFINISGKRSHFWIASHEVEEDEIGDTPENAIRNQV